MSAVFHKGDLLVIRPQDDDDPDANARTGQACRFLRYGPTGLAVVEMEGARRPLYFRPQDLMMAQGQILETAL